MNKIDRIKLVHISLAVQELKQLTQGLLNEGMKEVPNDEQVESFVSYINEAFDHIERPIDDWNQKYGKIIKKEMDAEQRMFEKMNKNS